MSNRSYDKLRKRREFALTGRYAEAANSGAGGKCDGSPSCTSTGSHQTGCPVLAETLRRLKK